MSEPVKYATATEHGDIFYHGTSRPEPGAPLPEAASNVVTVSVEAPPPVFPALHQQARNFVASMKDWALNGFRLNAERNERWEVCQSCEFLAGGKRCAKCGCWMETKTHLESARCPVGKW